MTSSAEVRIRSLPEGEVRASDFELAERALPAPNDGEVVVRNEWMSLDPYMRLGLTRQSGYVAALGPGDVLGGPAIGIVEASRAAAFPVGSRVVSQLGWRSRFVSTPDGAGLAMVPPEVRSDWYLGFLGLTGVTAWLGIEHVLQPLEGETMFISGAAGAVGSIACQLAKLRGARVLASAGSDDKARWLIDELGADAVVNYRSASVSAFLAEQAPEGVDCYFDNVGGAMLDTLLTHTRPGGRIGLCGAMSQYQTDDYRCGPANFFAVIENDLRLTGFNAFRLAPAEWNAFTTSLNALAEQGRLKPCQSIVEGIETVPQAFAAMFAAGQTGKLIVRI